MSTPKFATNALHAGHDVTVHGGTRAVPIYQSTSFVFEDADHAADLFSLAKPGYIYTRLNNPTNDILSFFGFFQVQEVQKKDSCK